MMPYMAVADPETNQITVGDSRRNVFFLRGPAEEKDAVLDLIQAANERMHKSNADDPLAEFYAIESEFPEYKLSFGLEFSSIIDWVADITPRANHPQARQYPLWRGQGTTPQVAVADAVELARAAIAKHKHDGGVLTDHE